MNANDWITLLTFLQTAETLPQDEDELEIANGDILKIESVSWEFGDLN